MADSISIKLYCNCLPYKFYLMEYFHLDLRNGQKKDPMKNIRSFLIMSLNI